MGGGRASSSRRPSTTQHPHTTLSTPATSFFFIFRTSDRLSIQSRSDDVKHVTKLSADTLNIQHSTDGHSTRDHQYHTSLDDDSLTDNTSADTHRSTRYLQHSNTYADDEALPGAPLSSHNTDGDVFLSRREHK